MHKLDAAKSLHPLKTKISRATNSYGLLSSFKQWGIHKSPFTASANCLWQFMFRSVVLNIFMVATHKRLTRNLTAHLSRNEIHALATKKLVLWPTPVRIHWFKLLSDIERIYRPHCRRREIIFQTETFSKKKSVEKSRDLFLLDPWLRTFLELFHVAEYFNWFFPPMKKVLFCLWSRSLQKKDVQRYYWVGFGPYKQRSIREIEWDMAIQTRSKNWELFVPQP